jgi:putative membrane protein
MTAVHDIASLVADAGWPHHGAWWFPFGLLWLLALAVLIWFVARNVQTRRHSATDILAERYARGELSSEEFRERLDELRRHR